MGRMGGYPVGGIKMGERWGIKDFRLVDWNMSRFSTMLYSSKYILHSELLWKIRINNNSLCCVKCFIFHSTTLNSIIVIAAIMTVIITIIPIVYPTHAYTYVCTYVYRSSWATMRGACLGFAIAKCFALWVLSVFLPSPLLFCTTSSFRSLCGVFVSCDKNNPSADAANRSQRWEKSEVFAHSNCYDGCFPSKRYLVRYDGFDVI